MLTKAILWFYLGFLNYMFVFGINHKYVFTKLSVLFSLALLSWGIMFFADRKAGNYPTGREYWMMDYKITSLLLSFLLGPLSVLPATMAVWEWSHNRHHQQ